MASEFTEKKKKLLYSDLFKGNQSMTSSPGTESVLGSSSALSSPFGSELDSTETSGSEDEDFVAELTRQMAEHLLLEDEDNSLSNCVSHETKLRKQGRKSRGRRVRRSEYTQKKPFYQTEQQYKGANWGNGYPYGSGMRAVFLGGSGSSNGSCGTGVFLPRGSDVPAEHKKKSGVCSTVLIPTRVLQALELHFNRPMMSKDSTDQHSSQNSNDVHVNDSSRFNGEEAQLIEKQSGNENEETLLPQEWTYGLD
ncbi:uncharacterized protein LOC111393506 [Olea europaea var. sylvestris]|uniref:uncharacterized protein LOC111393506 n=1 Tax=Olea europaea var. sylvestris TaxID=158386 RepID=UPI000C1CFA05|nr:uncharacterized protein LOC111393506 [Olea europaea var. sylvestris]